MVKEAVKEVKQAKSNAVAFTKHLSGTIVALSLLGLGGYAAYLGHYKTQLRIGTIALLFAGAINAIVGCVVLYRVLMHRES